MPAVFVHGVPDTERVWSHVVSRLGRADVVTLSLPGFGCAAPDGFAATKEAYVDWLLDALASLTGPIDLVGHDWGALLVVRAVSLRPGLARTWAAGGAPLDPEYVWHQAARAWQTPEVGERVMEQMTPDALRRALIVAGVPEADAAESSRHVDATMKRCILALYRSAIHAGREWHADLSRVAAQGLVLWGTSDPYAEPRFGRRLAELTGARFGELPCSHWWPLERPDDVVRELRRLWAG
ncbi:MAG: alpha/beta fold hydrolase [Candidatus Rokuibacteriota bacterium]